MRKYLTVKNLVIVILFLAVCISATTIYLQYPIRTFVIRKSPVILTKEIKAGDNLRWHSNVCRYSKKPFESLRTLENLDTGAKISLPEVATTSSIKVGECAEKDRSTIVPEYVPSGRYRLDLVVYTRVNRWNLVEVDSYSDEFIIK